MRRLGIAGAVCGLACGGVHAAAPPLYPIDQAISKGVVNARISLFSASDREHVLGSIGGLDPGMIYGTYVAVWGVIRQQDIDGAGELAGTLRRLLPRTILGAGINESVTLSVAPQTLACGGALGTRSFAPAAMTTPGQKLLGGTAWLDLASAAARDYYLCVGMMLIDRGFTLIDFEEHENVILHASSKPAAVSNLVAVMTALRRFGAGQGEAIYFSGDPATDDTGKEIDFVYAPSRFFHTTFAQKYQNKIIRKGIGVGYSYSLSPRRVRDVLAAVPRHARVFFYVDNFDPKQDDLRRFMELDGANRRYLLETSAATAHRLGAYFIPNLLHCIGCVPTEVVGDPCEITPGRSKSEYDAVACGDLPTIRTMLEVQR